MFDVIFCCIQKIVFKWLAFLCRNGNIEESEERQINNAWEAKEREESDRIKSFNSIMVM